MDKIDDLYPETFDDDFQSKIYSKREYVINKFPEREKLTDNEAIENYRKKICTGEIKLREQQMFLSKFINPNTPYKGVIVMHGTGTGKCLLKTHKVVIENITYDDNDEQIIKKECLSLEDIHSKYASKTSIFDGCGSWNFPTEALYVNSMKTIVINNITYHKLVKKRINKIYSQNIDELANKVYLKTYNKKEKSITITKAHKLYTDIGWTNQLHLAKYIMIPKYSIETEKKITNIECINCLFDDFVFAKIDKIVEEYIIDCVYDLEIEDTHNFISEDILVSNTCAGITIAEGFKNLVNQYQSKIFILVGGPLIKENWKSELVKCAGSAYVPELSRTKLTASSYRNFKSKVLTAASQYYRFITYTTFYKKVLGEKIPNRAVVKGKKQTYKKKDGKFARDIKIDRIKNINNGLIIVDEAHHMVNNFYGEALKKIIDSSKNLKVVLMTATPMRNLADDFVELLNFIRPNTSPIRRDKIFTSKIGHNLEFKKGGLEYLKKMSTGYISYLKGADPITFAQRVDIGIIPKTMLYTKVIRCFMLDFQKQVYLKMETDKKDSLDKHSEAIANFVFPTLNSSGKIIGVFGKEGLSLVKEKINLSYDLFNKEIAKKFNNDDKNTDRIYIDKSNNESNTISGEIFSNTLLKNFSIKFYIMLNELNELVWSKKGIGLAFVYSNLVKTGIELIKEMMLVDGYIEYTENANEYRIEQNTKCYYCGCEFHKHVNKKSLINNAIYPYKNYTEGIQKSYVVKNTEPPLHTFYPAVFITVTGKVSDVDVNDIQEEKQKILRDIFSIPKNKEGKFIKVVIGSQVMTEGLSLSNVKEVHIIDANFHLGKVDQIIGRAIRDCYHYDLMTKDNPYPEVKIYKYVISLRNDEMTSEELLYKKAEKKYHLIKQVERVLQEVAVDCPLNRNVNVFAEEIEKYKGCNELDINNLKQTNVCPASCNFKTCEMKCDGAKLNKLFWDDTKKIYIDVEKKDIDYSTFTKDLISGEVEFAKKKIKELYKIKSFYSLMEIVEYVKRKYDVKKKYLYDDYFTFCAIDSYILKDENDFNKYMGGLYDKFGRQGYLIQVSEYYIFQSYEYPENVSMYYRENFDSKFQLNSSVNNFIKSNPNLNLLEDTVLINEKKKVVKQVYDFDSVLEYYENRNEYIYVGIIDSMIQKTINSKIIDIFKIRENIKKDNTKKRAPGIPSLKGSVCATSKTKEYLKKVARTLNIDKSENKRVNLCDMIKNKLMFMEKYGTNNITYLIIPANHGVYKFPFNLVDRTKYIIDKVVKEIPGVQYIKKIIPVKVSFSKDKVSTYEIIFSDSSKNKVFEQFGGKLMDGKWKIIVD